MSLHELENKLKEGNVENYTAFAIPDIPEIVLADDLGLIISQRAELLGGFKDGDVIVVASKIVSKAEGRIFNVSDIYVSPEALELSRKINKPPQICQVILNESTNYCVRGSTVIARHKLGYIITSAGVDRMDDSTVCLISKDPDSSAKKIRERIEELAGCQVTVIISDSEGREDRAGAGAIALGISGMNPLRVTGVKTNQGKSKRSEETLSDLLASAANVIIGQRGKQTPAVCIRGLNYQRDLESRVSDILHFSEK